MGGGFLLESRSETPLLVAGHNDFLTEKPITTIRPTGQVLLPGGVVIPRVHHGDDPQPLDLSSLIKALESHHKQDGTVQAVGHQSWEMRLIQGFLITLLIMVSISWACCCKKRCLNAAPPTVQQALRKLSSSSTKSKVDLPPSYSNADLHTLAMSVQDYLYPPPSYIDIFRSAENLSYLDLEAGHRNLSRLSFCGNQSASDLIALSAAVSRKSSLSGVGQGEVETAILAPIVAAVTAASRKNSAANNEQQPIFSIGSSNPSTRSSSVSSRSSISMGNRSLNSSLSSSSFPSDYASTPVKGHRRRSSSVTSPPGSASASRRTSIIKDQSSRKSSDGSEDVNRRHSRVSFSEEVECSNGTISKLNSPLEISRKSSSDSSRKSSSGSSSSGDGSRKSSLLISRKLGLSQDTLDKELRKKLEKLAAEEAEVEAEERRRIEEERQKLETVLEIERY